MTIANMVDVCHLDHVVAFCTTQGCGHYSRLSIEGWPRETPVPDIALRLRCTKCGKLGSSQTRPDWANYRRHGMGMRSAD